MSVITRDLRRFFRQSAETDLVSDELTKHKLLHALPLFFGWVPPKATILLASLLRALQAPFLSIKALVALLFPVHTDNLFIDSFTNGEPKRWR